MAAFHPKYWPGTLYHDTSKAFYSELGGGRPINRNVLPALLNPFSEMWKNVSRARKSVSESNFKGKGTIMGGLFVFGQGGKVQYKHVEDTFGQHAPHAKVWLWLTSPALAFRLLVNIWARSWHDDKIDRLFAFSQVESSVSTSMLKTLSRCMHPQKGCLARIAYRSLALCAAYDWEQFRLY